MKKIDFKILIVTCVVCLLPIILGLIYYNDLPENVAIHFDINNNPDNYFSKQLFIFGMPVFMVVLQTFCCIISDLQDTNPEANKKAVGICKWIIPIITIMMYAVTLMYALGSAIDIRKVVMIVLGILFIISGNYLPKTVGNTNVNLPKVEDESINRQIKKIAGCGLIIDGAFCIISILFVPMVSLALVVLFVLETIALYLYAFIKSKKKN